MTYAEMRVAYEFEARSVFLGPFDRMRLAAPPCPALSDLVDVLLTACTSPPRPVPPG